VAARALPGASQVEMLVATTRMRTTPAEMFSGFRGPALDFADIVVSLPPDSVRQIGEVQLPRQIPGDPATDFVTLKADYNDRTQALATFRRLVRTTPKKQVLVFVHGFNNRFEDAVFRFAQFVHDSGVEAQVVPVLFTWPSKARVLAYVTTARASSTHAMSSKAVCASSPKIPKSARSPCSPIRWETG
jgi:esterase/lipase superfamily enzyme